MKTIMMMRNIFFGLYAFSVLGCTSGMTAHQNIHRNVDDVTTDVSLQNSINNATGGATTGLFLGAFILNHIFRPSPDANSSCVNGLGQKVDCETKEVLANALVDADDVDEKNE